MIIFLKQSLRVAGGFWISVKYPDIIMQIVEFVFKDNINSAIPSIFGLGIFVYMLLRVHREYLNNKEEIKPVTISLLVCGLVILVTLLVSLYRAVFIPRYMIPMSALAIFAFATILAKEDKKWLKAIICIGLVALSIWNGYTYLKTGYDERNQEPWNYMKDEIQQGDIIIYKEIGIGSIAALKFNGNEQYFYNKDYWPVEEAYGAFAPQMKTVRDLESELKDFTGRIWVLDTSDNYTYDYLENIENTDLKLEKAKFYAPYCGQEVVISLFEKN